MNTKLAHRERWCALDSINAAQNSALGARTCTRVLGVMSTRTCRCGVFWQDDGLCHTQTLASGCVLFYLALN